MTSIGSFAPAPRFSFAAVGPSPAEEERQRLRQFVKGGGSPGPQQARSPGYAPSLGGYGGGSAFFVQSLGPATAPQGGGTGAPGAGVGGGAGPIGGGTDTGPVDSGGGTAPVGGGGTPQTSAAYSMQSGDGFDLFTGSVIQGASSFPADSGLSTGDFQLTADGAGGVSITLGSGMGLPLQISIQRGEGFDSVTSAQGASFGDGSSPQSIGPGDTAVIDYAGFMTYAIGNVRQEADGSIGFDVKEIPASPPAPVDPEAQAAAAAVWQAQMAMAAYAAASVLANVSGGTVTSDGGVSTAGGGTPGISSTGPTGGAAAGSGSASAGGASSGGASGGSSSGGSSGSVSTTA